MLCYFYKVYSSIIYIFVYHQKSDHSSWTFFFRKVNILDNWRHVSGRHGDTDHSWGQDKDEGGPGRGVLHYLLHVKDRGLSELGAQVVDDKGGGTEGHTIRAQRAHQ